jgi:hypothetical protein
MKNALDKLRAYLAQVLPGPVKDVERVEELLAACWDQLAGPEGGMTGEKLINRTEDMRWNPPLLRFNIERHGARALGSVYAEVQRWVIDIEKGSADFNPYGGRRLVGARQPPVRVEPIANELVGLIVAGKEDRRLKWRGKSRVRLFVGEVLPEHSAVKQTLAGRRRRLRQAMQNALAAHGWQEIGLYTYEKMPRA